MESKTVHLIRGKGFGFISHVKEGPALILGGNEVHLPYGSTWYLIHETDYRRASKLDGLIFHLRQSVFGRALLAMSGFKAEAGAAV